LRNLDFLVMSEQQTTSMESRALLSLRREVRHLVYRTCRQRLEGDETGAQQALDSGLANLLAAETVVVAKEPAVREWVEAEEAEFDRALLISDLVASRLGRDARRENARAKASRAAPPPPASAQPRPASAGVPGIADMLDDMLSQQRRPTARSS
jgi:hypothetical protein